MAEHFEKDLIAMEEAQAVAVALNESEANKR